MFMIILFFCWFRMVFQICMTFQYPQEIFKYLLKPFVVVSIFMTFLSALIKGSGILYLDTLIDLSQMDNALARLMIETINNVLIEIYASLAQAEMEKKEKRQREGMEAKKLRGEWDEVGRPRAIEPEKFNQEFLRVIEKEVTPTQLQRELGLTASTFYRYRKDFFEKFPQFVQFQK